MSEADETERNLAELDEEIAVLAYQLWEAEGRPQGQDRAFWLRAEDKVLFRRDAGLPLNATGPARQETNPESGS